MIKSLRWSAFVLQLCLATNLLAKPLEIAVWNSFSGHLGDVFQTLCDEFNQSQNKYSVKSIYKGNYTESLTSFAAAFRADKAPDVIQVFEVGTQTMLSPEGIITPLYRLAHDNGIDIDESDFLPAISHYYKNEANRLVALPFNSSVPVLYYNKTRFKALGINKSPKTWQQLEALQSKLTEDDKCLYTTAYPSWVHLEAFSAIHRLPLAYQNAGNDVRLSNRAYLNHFKRLKRWQEEHLFQYGGRNDDASSLFTSGHCLMMTQSSGGYKSLSQTTPFELGVTAMPYDESITKARGNSIIGGAAFWVVARRNQERQKGVAQFFKFLMKADIQARWALETGYLPVTKKAMQRLQQFNQLHPGLKVAFSELSHESGRYARIRLGGHAQIRIINDEELESVLANTKSADKALADASIRDNYVLIRFQKNVKNSV